MPRQQRSRETESVLLEAAARVLAEGGVAHFNTNRVAERAGVSIGSLYQYYPDKAALLFRLHELESRDTSVGLEATLADRSMTPRRRLFTAVRAFFETEAAEVELRRALQQARIDFRDSEAFATVDARAFEVIVAFLTELRVDAARDTDFDARFLMTVLASVSERLTHEGVHGPALQRWADACSTMLGLFLGLDPQDQNPPGETSGGLDSDSPPHPQTQETP